MFPNRKFPPFHSVLSVVQCGNWWLSVRLHALSYLLGTKILHSVFTGNGIHALICYQRSRDYKYIIAVAGIIIRMQSLSFCISVMPVLSCNYSFWFCYYMIKSTTFLFYEVYTCVDMYNHHLCYQDGEQFYLCVFLWDVLLTPQSLTTTDLFSNPVV